MKHAVPDDPAHPEASGSHGEPIPDAMELLTDIGSQCRFMAAILRDIQSQLDRIERGVRQVPEGVQLHQGQQQTPRGQDIGTFNRP